MLQVIVGCIEQRLGVRWTWCWENRPQSRLIPYCKLIARYVDFCMRQVRMLQHFGVVPYIVLDGGLLPIKAGKEEERRLYFVPTLNQRAEYNCRRRAEAQEKVKKLLAENKRAKALEYCQQSVDVTPRMALEFIKALRKNGVKYVVAPYEADAQLAFLDMNGLVDGVITEDSDLLVYGCKRVLYKLDKNGNGIEILSSRIGEIAEINLRGWTMDQFKHMCILSGCDYLSSIPGIGLKTAYKLLRKHRTVEKVINAVRFEMSMTVPVDYLNMFRNAEATFKHQRVFDPTLMRTVPLTPASDEELQRIDSFIGPCVNDYLLCLTFIRHLDDKIAVRISKGELDPISMADLIDFDNQVCMFL